MIDERAIQHFLSDIDAHIDARVYDGLQADCCLVGQLFDYVATPEQELDLFRVYVVAAHYGLPSDCVDAIFCTAAKNPFRLNLEAAVWMAEYYLRHWTDDLAAAYLDHQFEVELDVCRLRNEFVLLQGV